MIKGRGLAFAKLIAVRLIKIHIIVARAVFPLQEHNVVLTAVTLVERPVLRADSMGVIDVAARSKWIVTLIGVVLVVQICAQSTLTRQPLNTISVCLTNRGVGVKLMGRTRWKYG